MKTVKIFVHVSSSGARSYFPQDKNVGRLCEQDGLQFMPKKPRGQWGVISFSEARRRDKKAEAKVGENGFKIIRHIAENPCGKHLVNGRIVSCRQITAEFTNRLSASRVDKLVTDAIGTALGVHTEIVHVSSLAEMKFV
ncbi:hypothetical protein KGQ27_03175 [Patescibacteria group bacterium]|nr:hypothetical protein [Patescibacteria group bacterium]MDE1946733.1 hypothetical protein [Patescibacteria group bacterium]MDE2010964.1 hypothetical protein [Patescibacteria group bacterium]MDE2232807.1 hypothetical protein [Patescibacteria group bacterium]